MAALRGVTTLVMAACQLPHHCTTQTRGTRRLPALLPCVLLLLLLLLLLLPLLLMMMLLMLVLLLCCCCCRCC
jgi:hypothetical protein